jgi:hypothetical protein
MGQFPAILRRLDFTTPSVARGLFRLSLVTVVFMVVIMLSGEFGQRFTGSSDRNADAAAHVAWATEAG